MSKDKKQAPASSRSFMAWVWDWAKSIAVALVVWFVLRTFLVEAFRIPSGSMEQTLLIGDFLFVNKALYGAEVPLIHKRLPAFREPRQNEIIVFDSVEEDIKVVKRLIGMPGDTLAMEAGQLIRNGVRVPEPYVIHSDPLPSADPVSRQRMRQWQMRYLVDKDPDTYRPDIQDWGPIQVPPDSYFVMGDSRDNSHDSRMWGFLPRANVRGTPMVVYFSYDQTSWRPLPFFTEVRWGRLFSKPN
jgi:signal peptidase I